MHPDYITRAIVQSGRASYVPVFLSEIPSAVLSHLAHHRDLLIHTEMFSDGVIPLIESGIINNRFKKIHPHKVVSSFAIGSKRLYDFLHNNPLM